VCKSWQDFVFDGQLWANMDLCAFLQLPIVLLKRLSDKSGAFVKRLGLTGHTRLDSSSLADVINNLSPMPMLYPLHTNITSVSLRGCIGINSDVLDFLLRLTPSLQHLDLKGSKAASNYICRIIGENCPHLVSLDLSQCSKVDGNGLVRLASYFRERSEPPALKSLKMTGMRYVTDDTLFSLGRAFPNLEVLDLSYVRSLHNSALDAFVSLDDDDDDDDDDDKGSIPSVLLSARQLGRDGGQYRRRVTRLRHLNLSFCLLLSDIGVSNLAHSMPCLEFLELAGIGPDLADEGLVRLLETTPLIRRLDLEDAGISDRVLVALTPPEPAQTTPTTLLRGNSSSNKDKDEPPHAGRALEQLTISSVTGEITDETISVLIQRCSRLRVLEADGTPMSGTVLREFVRTMRRRKVRNARVVAVDCRMVGESVVQDMLHMEIARPRLGWRAYGARALAYIDGKDKEDRECLALRGYDECDEARVVVKSFYAWQALDRVQLAREKAERRSGRARRFEGGVEAQDGAAGRMRWWRPSGRSARRPGTTLTPPHIFDTNNDRDGCIIM
jgi:F-box and leucine-rich repeat protein 2/20